MIEVEVAAAVVTVALVVAPWLLGPGTMIRPLNPPPPVPQAEPSVELTATERLELDRPPVTDGWTWKAEVLTEAEA